MPTVAERGLGVVVGGPYSSGALVGGPNFEYAPATPKILAKVAFNGFLQGSSGLSATNKVYSPAADTITYDAFLGAPRTYGMTLRAKF